MLKLPYQTQLTGQKYEVVSALKRVVTENKSLSVGLPGRVMEAAVGLLVALFQKPVRVNSVDMATGQYTGVVAIEHRPVMLNIHINSDGFSVNISELPHPFEVR